MPSDSAAFFLQTQYGSIVIGIHFFNTGPLVPAADERGVTHAHCCTKPEMSPFIHCDIKARLGGGW